MSKVKKIIDCLAIIWPIIIIIIFAIYCLVPANTSDYVEGVFWADASLRAKSILSQTFIYPYAIPIGGNLIILPYVALFGICQLANKLGMLTSYVILLIVFFLFVSSLIKLNHIDRIILGNLQHTKIFLCGVAILLTGYRSMVGDNQLRHLLNYQLSHICFVGMLATIIFIMIGKCPKYIWGMLALFVLWNSANGFIQVCLSSIPVMSSLILVSIIYVDYRKRALKCLGFIGVFSIMGLVFNHFIVIDVKESGYLNLVSSYSFQDVATWVEGVRVFPEDWLSLFVRYNPKGIFITSFSGVEVILCVCFALLMFCVPFVCFYLLKLKKMQVEETFILFSSVVVWLICLIQMFFFRGAMNRSYINNGIVEQRLLFNCVLVNSVLLCVLYMKYVNYIEKTIKVKYLVSLLFLLFAVFSAWLPVKANWKPDDTLVESLETMNLTYGFSTYWNANYNTVLSSDKVKIRPIEIHDGTIVPMRYQSDYSWYNKESNENDRFFVLLNKSEYDGVISSQNDSLFSLSIDELEINDYHILVYKRKDWEQVISGL